MSDRNNTFLFGSKDGMYLCPHVMKVPGGQAYDPAVMADVSVQYADYIAKVVLAPLVFLRPGPSRPERILIKTRWRLQGEHMSPGGQGSRRRISLHMVMLQGARAASVLSQGQVRGTTARNAAQGLKATCQRRRSRGQRTGSTSGPPSLVS